MKILLLHPPVSYNVPIQLRAESLGLGYIAAVLRRDGHEVEIFDAQVRCLNPRETVREILMRNFDCLGITASHELKDVLLSTVRAVRKRKKDIIIAAGGYLPTLSTVRLLTTCPELDFVVRGEGETTASDVFGRIARGESWQDAPGIAYLKDKSPVLNPMPPPIKNLDSLPFPARDGLRQMVAPIPARIAGSRGCYYRCSFCCIRSFYTLSGAVAPRFRSPRNIADEIESIVATTGIKDFRFIDDNFTGPGKKTREWVMQIAEEIRAHKLGITFAIECRADEVDEDILKLLKEAGLAEVFIGIESAAQTQLDRYNKHVTVEQNRHAIETVRRCGLKLRSGFIMFDPYLTLPELLENMQFISDTGIAKESMKIVSVPFVSKVKLFPEVPLVERLRADGLLREKGFDVNYVFKDWRIRLIYYALLALGLPNWLFHSIFGYGRRKLCS